MNKLRLLELRPSGNRFDLAYLMQTGTIPAGREFMHHDSRQRNCNISLNSIPSCCPWCCCPLEKGLLESESWSSRHCHEFTAVSKHKQECCHGERGTTSWRFWNLVSGLASLGINTSLEVDQSFNLSWIIVGEAWGWKAFKQIMFFTLQYTYSQWD